MNFFSYLKDKLLLIVLSMFSAISIEILLIPYDINIIVRLYILFSIFFAFIVGILVEYFIKRNYYNDLNIKLNELKDKYLISELIDIPDFCEGKILKGVVEEAGKSMLENVNVYKHLQDDYKEYIELWIHEIKIPISASKMIIENNKTSVTKSIDEELDKVENYTEQALYYARSNTAEKDYLIKKYNLKEIINQAILKNTNSFVNSKISLEMNDLDIEVYTDSKWSVFIVNQIIQNSIKYSSRKITIFKKELKENVVLYIKDDGLGISKGDLDRVFEKGFTGENGRIIGKKSTGIGLYLCKKLCDKLRIGLQISSKKGEGTEVRIIFPKGSYTSFSK